MNTLRAKKISKRKEVNNVAHIFHAQSFLVCLLAMGSGSQSHFSLTTLKKQKNVWEKSQGLLVRFDINVLELKKNS